MLPSLLLVCHATFPLRIEWQRREGGGLHEMDGPGAELLGDRGRPAAAGLGVPTVVAAAPCAVPDRKPTQGVFCRKSIKPGHEYLKEHKIYPNVSMENLAVRWKDTV